MVSGHGVTRSLPVTINTVCFARPMLCISLLYYCERSELSGVFNGKDFLLHLFQTTRRALNFQKLMFLRVSKYPLTAIFRSANICKRNQLNDLKFHCIHLGARGAGVTDYLAPQDIWYPHNKFPRKYRTPSGNKVSPNAYEIWYPCATFSSHFL